MTSVVISGVGAGFAAPAAPTTIAKWLLETREIYRIMPQLVESNHIRTRVSFSYLGEI